LPKHKGKVSSILNNLLYRATNGIYVFVGKFYDRNIPFVNSHFQPFQVNAPRNAPKNLPNWHQKMCLKYFSKMKHGASKTTLGQ